ncbi:hypothetical protein IW140_006014 [Coemansia sp. RSA 1813]|nr:hypothetical protein EV178_003362 [Coemansia sp. RSA 1646]KAJ1774126.1 hypothetical protein LPJ74_000225 [Coemansia sp. RSA 1843]KAJ2086013.1 hypothetical protein IW138_005969 [Coemansia sp. RSA 986]KAJ2210791.1 hypothetical protein EV179_005991 [Coemansia sp. RSA 487]KAJ2563697.1 hypothetical protein IW140_006014 [Coemansia sp. RSA 1813]
MTDGPRVRAEKERQMLQKRTFLSIAGIGFGASLFAAVMIGHRRAHRQALTDGESIQRGQVNWALRAFGIGTLYAVAFVGMTAAAGSYYLHTKENVSSIEKFSQLMQTKATEKLGGLWIRKRYKVDDAKDQEAAEELHRLISESDEVTGEKKIRFARVKKLMSKGSDESTEDSPASENDSDAMGEPKKLSVGGRMRAIFGYGKNSKG